jgi:hypothetical protein
MALMMQGKMLDVMLVNGKKIVTMPDSSRMELTISNGQQVLVPADTNGLKNTMLRLQNGVLRPVKLDSGKLRMQVQTNKSVELQKKETAVSPAQK